jgi:muramoyltetrapeptide carboxypeptidase
MTIGVVAPSSGIRDERLQAGLDLLQARGYRVVLGQHLFEQHGYVAGSDASRGEDLTTMFAHIDVDAVMCARGGYGACRMLNHVDWEVVAANPKVFIGYSDITTLHLAMEQLTGMVTVHGPMVVSHGGGLSETAADCFWRIVERAEPYGCYPDEGAKARKLVGGKAAGRLAGGCIELLTVATGTPEAPDFTGRIVVLEDVGAPPYRIDRALTQMIRAGLLDKAAGFVIGTVTGWDKGSDGPHAITIDDVWKDLIAPLGKPAIVNFPFGHEPDPLTIPLGCMAELNADDGTLTVVEAAVS